MPSSCQWSVQGGVWGWSGCASGICSQPLFILLREALLRQFHTGVSWQLLYADDLAVMADSLKECITRLNVWKEGMEHKRLSQHEGNEDHGTWARPS